MNESVKIRNDLIWIISVIIGEIFITGYITLMLIRELDVVGVLSLAGMVYLSIIIQLILYCRSEDDEIDVEVNSDSVSGDD
jgi:hypothetical protein